MYRVVKRDGRIVDFEISKIANAMKKAFDATETNYNQSVIDFLAVMVTADFQPKITDELIHIEDIQDSVESVLSRGGYENVAKAYILYRKQHENLRAVSDTVLDYSRILSFGRPVSSAIWQLPIGAITRRFLIVRRLTWMGENIVSYGQSSLV